MKRMKMKSIICSATFSLFLIVLFAIQSCDSNENVEALISEKIDSKEVLELKKAIVKNKDLILKVANQQVKTKGNNGAIEVPTIFKDLNKKSLKMLESYGVHYSDIEDVLENENDPKITLIGMFFAALIEENSNVISVPRTKSQSEGDDGVCYTAESVTNCILTAVGITEIAESLQSVSCVSKTLALTVFKTAAKRALGAAGVAYALISFGDCMGWYDIM